MHNNLYRLKPNILLEKKKQENDKDAYLGNVMNFA